MKELTLKLTLLSDTTFGRGDGVAGLVDSEVQHDEAGLPYLGGRALKGLIGAECDDIIFALQKAMPDKNDIWAKSAARLLGKSGAHLQGEAILRVGPAKLPDDLRAALIHDIASGLLMRAEILDLLTTLRRQTAMDESGAPRKESLRTMRVILTGTVFSSSLVFAEDLGDDDLALALLAASVKALRRIGTGRNRGRGKVMAELIDVDGKTVTETYFEKFRKAVQG